MTKSAVAEVTEEAKAKKAGAKVVRLETESAEDNSTKARIKAIREKLFEHLGHKDKEKLDAYCVKLGFNDFFHVRRLVNLEASRGYVNSPKYLDGLTEINTIVGTTLAIKLDSPKRGPRSRNPITSGQARALMAGEEVEIEGTKYKLVQA